jgi:sugar/nucleoside kinase (ribokinase family)
LGVFVRNKLRAEKIAVDGVIIDRRRQTSSTIVTVHPDGERSFLHTRGCMQNFTARDVLAHMSLVGRAGWLAFGYLGLLPECEPELPRLFSAVKRRTGTRILLDTGGNPGRSPSLLRRILPWVDVFVPSYEEAVALTGLQKPAEMVAAFRRLGAAGTVGIKLGADGCYLDHRGEAVHIPAQRVRSVVDTTGAGDAFVAGFLAATVRGFPPADAARIAIRVAASCVTAVGASTAIRSFTTYQQRRS